MLRTPAIDLWFPTPAELRAVHYTTGDPPNSVLAADHGWPPRLSDFAQRLWTAPDEAVLQFGTALSDLLVLLQAKNPEACWAFAHEGPDAPQAALPPIALDALAAAGKYLPNVPTRPRDKTADAEQSKKAAAELIAFIREKGMVQAMQGLRPGADHAVFCPSLHRLLQAAWRGPTHAARVPCVPCCRPVDGKCELSPRDSSRAAGPQSGLRHARLGEWRTR